MEKKFLRVVFALFVVIVLAVVGALVINRPAIDFHGSVIHPASPAPEIALTDQNGQPFALSSLRGRVVALFFGFTSCTDECPATLAILRQTALALGDQAADFQVVFVTTDPARDTPAAIGAYLAGFDPSFVGLTGSTDALQQAWSDYGVTVLDNGETHSTFIYLIDRQGNLRLTYPFGINSADLTTDIQALLQEE